MTNNPPRQVETPEGKQTPGGESTPTEQPITFSQLKEVLNEWDKTVRQDFAKAFQGVQSTADKSAQRIQERIDKMIEAAESSGMKLNDSDKSALRAQAIMSEVQSPDQSPDEPPGDVDSLTAWVNTKSEQKMQEAGITIFEGDPETEILDAAAEKDPIDYLAAVDEAIAAKRARTSKDTPSVEPIARTPGAVKGQQPSNPIANVTDQDVLWDRIKAKGVFPTGK